MATYITDCGHVRLTTPDRWPPTSNPSEWLAYAHRWASDWRRMVDHISTCPQSNYYGGIREVKP